VDLGITGHDQVEEHDAGVQAAERIRRASITAQGPEKLNEALGGCEKVMDLAFGGCKLQVQAPEKGIFNEPKDLIGKTVCTSFVNLAYEYFRKLEQEQQNGTNGPSQPSTKLRTHIMRIGGSVEATCALGVADGIVDLVGKWPFCSSWLRADTP
jgi:ATP phosphoribosyltransferase